MNKIILITLYAILSFNASANIESEIESERLEIRGNVIIDNWSGLIWENSDHSTTKGYRSYLDRYGAFKAKDYCKKLTLENGVYSNFRLPTDAEYKSLYEFEEKFKKPSPYGYWVTNDNKHGDRYMMRSHTRDYTTTTSSCAVRCVQGNRYTKSNLLLKSIKQAKEKKAEQKSLALFKKVSNKNTLTSYQSFMKDYNDSKHYNQAKNNFNNLIHKTYLQAKEKNTIQAYRAYVDKVLPVSSQNINKSITSLYKLIKAENNIAGYQWFLESYPDSEQSRDALKQLHQLAFSIANDIDTIEAYNDFVIAYPVAVQVQQANDAAYALEKKEYSSYFTSDEKLSRALLVRSKQMERKARDTNYEHRPGYMMVVNRMNELLETEFPAEEATLRYLESEEFKSFYRDFKSVLNRIDSKLEEIRSNTADVSSLMKSQTELMENHFRESAESREMSAELTQQHRTWERYLKNN